MAETIDLLHYSTLTQAVNEIKSPNMFLKRLLFGQHQVVSTEKIELSVWTGGRQAAPFVRKNGEAVFVSGYGEQFHTVEAPNIRIKRAIDPHNLMFTRRPGQQVFPSRAEQSSGMQQYLSLQLQRLSDLATNAEEYLCAQAIRGTITYSVTDEEAFQVSYPKSAGNIITLSTFWDDATPANVEIEQDFLTAKQVVSEAVGLQPGAVILGSEAMEYFIRVLKSQEIMDKLHYMPGDVTLTNQFSNDGAIFLGSFSGIPVYGYNRQVEVNGTMTDLIRPKYAEFVCTSPAAENVLYYGAIADDSAVEGGTFVTERFSKSWKSEDPSQRYVLLHTRPLPVTRRPDAHVSMKVISG
jgi:hypothetical protein